VGLERQINMLFREVTGTGDGGSRVEDADVEREKAYEMALESEIRLGLIEEHAAELERELGELHGEEEMKVGRQEDGMGKVVDALNSQYNVLSRLEGRCKTTERNLGWVGRVMDMDRNWFYKWRGGEMKLQWDNLC